MTVDPAFTAAVLADAAVAFRVFAETGALTAAATLSFVVRAPDGRTLVEVKHPDRFQPDAAPRAVLTSLDPAPGEPRPVCDGVRYAEVFRAHPRVGAISHVHAPYLAAWAQTHLPLPLRYVPVQRHTLADHVPVYLDRREGEDAFIVRLLRADPEHFAILEANGGATVWSSGGLLDLARTILLLEEAAQAQALAAPLGGSRDFGPGVLAQQWSFFGLDQTPRARTRLTTTAATHPLPPA
ncbi:class II aldolase/adducin family protein [Actinocorallia sp. API 0066]|uniref:class II aldolase/adducin family protein n=1 Tax=Actinocorallia sp. API 0066 TaxID=2896846 RepID=UPI001E5DE579|nr:class II aldolase/adducin family protein [Actinocorallia sp. API 0066]MCD0451635.1 class II aldolase/adducin family protein [Actinocorallia sp. API 0066]